MTALDKAGLVALAERVEALTGPCRETDKLIAVACIAWCLHPRDRQRDDSAQSDRGYTCLDCGADSWGNTGPTGQKRGAVMPAYTASLDAAMTLVPEGWLPFGQNSGLAFWPQMDSEPTYGKVKCQLWCAHTSYVAFGIDVPEGIAATPALALTAAALRAIAAGQQ